MPEPERDRVMVRIRAAGLNHHDLWTLRGVGTPHDAYPIVLGAEGAGIDEDGKHVVVYPVIAEEDAEDPTLTGNAMQLLSSHHHGTMAEFVSVPRHNTVPMPHSMSFAESACLAGAWLTAYRMLFERSRAKPGDTVLVQGAGGGVSTALIRLGSVAGYRMWVTSRDPEKRRQAVELGAETAFATGDRLPHRVDAVMESVGAATWNHSMAAVRDGGTIVVCGATSGASVGLDLHRVYYRQISVVGSTLGSLHQLRELVAFCERYAIKPVVDRVLPLNQAHAALSALDRGETFGKVVLAP